MTQDPSPKWLDSLSADASAVPEIPGQVLLALRNRRRDRHRKMAAGWGGLTAVVAISGALWMFNRPVVAPSPTPIADSHPLPPSTPLSPNLEPGVITAASIYGNDPDLDRLAVAPPARDDRQMRIGDHWDPDRVEAWVLD